MDITLDDWQKLANFVFHLFDCHRLELDMLRRLLPEEEDGAGNFGVVLHGDKPVFVDLFDRVIVNLLQFVDLLLR